MAKQKETRKTDNPQREATSQRGNASRETLDSRANETALEQQLGIFVESEPAAEPSPPGENVSDFPEMGLRLDPELSAGDSNREVDSVEEASSNAATWMEQGRYNSNWENRTGTYEVNLGGRRGGGPTGGDFVGGGGGPAIGETHPADENADIKIGSREETEAALENKIARKNAQELHDTREE